MNAFIHSFMKKGTQTVPSTLVLRPEDLGGKGVGRNKILEGAGIVGRIPG